MVGNSCQHTFWHGKRQRSQLSRARELVDFAEILCVMLADPEWSSVSEKSSVGGELPYLPQTPSGASLGSGSSTPGGFGTILSSISPPTTTRGTVIKWHVLLHVWFPQAKWFPHTLLHRNSELCEQTICTPNMKLSFRAHEYTT